MTEAALSFLDPGDGPRLAFRLRDGDSPTLMWLPGYASDMEGTKVLALDAFAEARGLSMLRFDYSGNGSSEGEFEDGTLERWVREAELLFDEITRGPAILVGSSMGGWIALHLALRRPERVSALVGIAAAPDFTEWGYTEAEKAEIAASGRLVQPNISGGDPWLTTRNFWESGQRLCLLEEPIDIICPVRLIHGDQDPEVPLSVASRLLGALRSDDVQLTIVKGGGHRLSQPHEIEAILRTVEGLLERAE